MPWRPKSHKQAERQPADPVKRHTQNVLYGRRCNGLKAAFTAIDITIGEWISNSLGHNGIMT